MSKSSLDLQLLSALLTETLVFLWLVPLFVSIFPQQVSQTPKSLPEAKLKSLQLIVLAEETSKQFTADFVVWLLVIILMHIYNAKSKQSKVGGARTWKRAKSCDKQIKEKPVVK